MSLDNILDSLHLLIQIFIKSPVWYKILFISTCLSVIFLVIYAFKMYSEVQKHLDLDASNIHISVEKEFNERALSFDIESISQQAVYINQIQVAIYDAKKNEDALYLVTKGGQVNPLKIGDKLSYKFILDSSFDTGFNFTKVIKKHEYAWQAYKVIVIVHYNHHSLSNIKTQRFEYLYRVRCYDGNIDGTIDQFPNKMNDSKLIYKKVPYELQ